MPPKQIDVNKIKSGNYVIGVMSDYYHIEGDSFISTGSEDFTAIYEFDSETKEIIQTQDYVLVKYEEYWIPIRLPDKTNSFSITYKGKLAAINDEVLNQIKERAANTNIKEFDPDKLLDITLDTMVEPGLFTYITLIISSILILIAISNIYKVVRRYRDPYSSPIIQNLNVYGDMLDIIQSIENEVGSGVYTYGKVVNTESWLILKRIFTIDIVPLSNIIWIYIRNKWIKWGIIPVFRTVELSIILRDNENITTTFASVINAEDVLNKIQNFAPWVLTGYSKELRKMYKSDLGSLVEKVDHAKMQL
jgi:hypothetical protein